MCKDNIEIKCKYCGEMNENRPDANFCIYCGKPIINICINNKCDVNTLDDNAAFCYKCGEPSLFNDYSIISPKYIDNMDLPF